MQPYKSRKPSEITTTICVGLIAAGMSVMAAFATGQSGSGIFDECYGGPEAGCHDENISYAQRSDKR